MTPERLPTTGDAWSYIAGEKGRNRVRVYDRPPHGIWIDYRADDGQRARTALHHSDREQAKRDADTIAAKFGTAEMRPAQPITLRALFEKYEREETPLKGQSKQKHDVRARLLFEACWGPATKVKDLDLSDWNRFIQQRRKGTLRPQGRKGKKKDGGVRDRVIAYDLKHLRTVIAWAQSVRARGKPLLEGDPCKGFPLPSEASPRRPATNEDEYGRLSKAAADLGGMAPLFLLMVHETGHRCSAVGLLRWSDFELSEKAGESWVRWREENDKIGFQHRTPLSSDAVDALKAARKATGSIGDAWVFPSPEDKARSVSRHFLRDLWQKLETTARLERQPGRGWHSLRRKFATDLKDTPLKDLCYMGGWKDPQTVLKCYQQPDESTMRSALDRRQKRSASA